MSKRKLSVLIISCALLLFTCSSVFAAVSYLGPAGTYTEEAAVKYFGEKERIFPFATVSEALEQVLTGKVEYAVVPVENTIGGPVYPYLDSVMSEFNFVIVGEVALPIRQTLLALPGTKLSDIKTVLSHPQGIAQSKSWLQTNLPSAKVTEVSSTAEGAKKVAETGDKSIAAIAASRTSLVYKLDILANDLQYTSNNVTRFWIVTTKNRVLQKGDKATLIISGDIQKLPKLLNNLDNQGLTVVTIHDRPTKTKFGEYTFLIEVIDKNALNSKDKDKDTLLAGLSKVAEQQKNAFSIRILGIYNQSKPL